MMALWFLMVVLCSVAAVLIAFPLIRSYEAGLSPAQDVAVYQDQLNEIARDLESGAINETEAKSARAEIERRLEVAAKARVEAKPLPPAWKYLSLAIAAGIVIVGGVGLYSQMGSPTLPAASQQTAQAGNDQQKQIEDIIAKIQAKVKETPNDPEAWRMLGWAMFNVQRFQDSVDAFTKAVALAPDNVDYQAMLAESTVQAAQGTVTPAAQKLIDAVLAKDPKNLRARYYDSIGHEQSGDQQGALDRWTALLADAPLDAGYRDDVKSRITALGKALNKDVSAALNAPPALSPEQMAMAEGMVQKQADDLKQNPKDAQGWARLIRSYSVLKQPDKAKAALTDALKAFDGDAETQGKIRDMAKGLGVSE
jgi:cytochrome c-type biogenesis protein CcmH